MKVKSSSPHANTSSSHHRSISLGHELNLNESTRVYVSGKFLSKYGLILIPEMMTWDTVRVRDLCDFFGEHDSIVVLPNFISKKPQKNTKNADSHENVAMWFKEFTFEGVIQPTISVVLNFLKCQGVEKVALLGLGWGSWVVANILSSELAEEFQCGALTNPSLELEEKFYGGSVPDLLSRINRPLLIILTRSDSFDYRYYFRLLKYKFPSSRILDYQNVEEDFSLIIDPKDDHLSHSMQECLEEIQHFFLQHFLMAASEIKSRLPNELTSIEEAIIDIPDSEEGTIEESQSEVEHDATEDAYFRDVSSYVEEDSFDTKSMEEALAVLSGYPSGFEVELDIGTQLYVVETTSTCKTGVIVIPDMMSWKSHTVRDLCELLGTQEWLVVVPNFRSTVVAKEVTTKIGSQTVLDWYRTITMEENIIPTILSVVEFMKEVGVSKIALFGIAWGSWVVAKILASEIAGHFQCGAFTIPSLDLEERIYGGSITELLAQLNRPVLIILTGGGEDSSQSFMMTLKPRFPSSRMLHFLEVDDDFLLYINAKDEEMKLAALDCLNEVQSFFLDHFNMTTPTVVTATMVHEQKGPIKIEGKSIALEQKEPPKNDENQNALVEGVEVMRERLKKTGESLTQAVKEQG